jgi:hypothetical protein
MGLVEFLLSFVWATAIAVAFFVTSIAASHAEFLFAKVVYIAGAFSLVAAYLVYLYKDQGPAWLWLLVGIALTGVDGFGAPTFVEWVAQREAGLHPDITAFLIYKDRPALSIANASSTTATEIGWGVLLWDLTTLDINPINVSGRIDFLVARAKTVPLNIFDDPRVASRISAGHKYIGSAGIVCPSCSRGHTYAIYVELGTDGWYAELPQWKHGEMLIPTEKMDTPAKLLQFGEGIMNSVVPGERLPIKELRDLDER